MNMADQMYPRVHNIYINTITYYYVLNLNCYNFWFFPTNKIWWLFISITSHDNINITFGI